MKCEHCQGTLSLEDAFCPNCGQPNTQARQHAADMARYQEEFQKTEKLVKEKSRRYGELTARIIILAVLVIAILVGAIAGASTYSIKRSILSSRANKQYTEYSKMMQEYLDNEQYQELVAFVDGKGITFYNTPYEQDWAYTVRLVRTYTDLFEYFNMCFFQYENDTSNRYSEYLNDSLDYFYKYANAGENDYNYPSNEKDLELLRKLSKDVELILKTYGGLTDEEVASFSTLTKSKRGSLLEDRLEVIKNGEE